MSNFDEEVDEADLYRIMLRKGIVEITFTKANGDTRVMRATLMKEHLPERENVSEEPPWGSTAIRCFDLDLKEWRSFRPGSVTTFRKI